MSYIHNIVYNVSQYSPGGTLYYTGGPRRILDHELYLFYLRREYTDSKRGTEPFIVQCTLYRAPCMQDIQPLLVLKVACCWQQIQYTITAI